MGLLTTSLFTDLIHMSLATFKSHDVLHPLVVHFPVALLMIAPVFVALGIVLQKDRRVYFLSALILMAIGTFTAYIAVSSGQAASELVDRTTEISMTLNRHKDLAKATRIIFSVLTLVFAGMIFLPALKKKIPAYILFLAVYSLGLVFLMNTAHQGGLLVHRYGVHAILPSSL